MRVDPFLIASLLGATLAAPALAADKATPKADWLDIEVGKSVVIELPAVPRAISVTDPNVADIVQLGAPTRWQVQGKAVGTTDLVLQFPGDVPPMLYEVSVHTDLSDLVRRVDAMIEGETPKIYPLNDRIVVEGTVADLDTLERVARLAKIYDPEFVNLMMVAGDHQVQLEVIVAEVSRTKTRQMGVNLFWSQPTMGASIQYGNPFNSAVPAGDITALTVEPSRQAFTLAGRVLQGIDIYGGLEALDRQGVAKILAQPTLSALSGQQSEMLVGGSYPVAFPNAQGNVTIKFKDYGTRVLFTPTVLAGDLIDIDVEVEVSSVDTSIGTTVNGTSVPGVTSRKVQTHVRLDSGMTLAIAGLLSERSTLQRDEVPGLGRIPVLGLFFRKVNHLREESELMIYVTPRLVRPLAPGELPPILGTTENNNPSDAALYLLGADHRARSRTAAPTGDVGLQR